MGHFHPHFFRTSLELSKSRTGVLTIFHVLYSGLAIICISATLCHGHSFVHQQQQHFQRFIKHFSHPTSSSWYRGGTEYPWYFGLLYYINLLFDLYIMEGRQEEQIDKEDFPLCRNDLTL